MRVGLLPDVAPAMTNPAYWSGKSPDPHQILATAREIERINREIVKEKGCQRHDLAAMTQMTFNGIEKARELKEVYRARADYFYHKLGAVYKDGKKMDYETAMRELYQPMIDNCADPHAEESMPVLYGICTSRTNLYEFPSQQALPDDPTDPDFDLRFLTAVRMGEAVIAMGRSADGKYYHVTTGFMEGWIPGEDIAFCKNRDQWLASWQYDPDRILVVYDDKIYTEESNYAPGTANKKLSMGTCLPLLDSADWSSGSHNRAACHNYVVSMPVRLDDGTCRWEPALISQHCKVNEGYLPLTAANLAMVAFNQLGNTYGWGGMLGSNDCSGFVQDLYQCFGLKLARNTGLQKAHPVKSRDLTGMTAEEKKEVIKKLPLGSLLFFPGHVMLYLGWEGDHLYVISATGTILADGIKSRIRGTVISTLDMGRLDGRSWLQALDTAQIPYKL